MKRKNDSSKDSSRFPEDTHTKSIPLLNLVMMKTLMLRCRRRSKRKKKIEGVKEKQDRRRGRRTGDEKVKRTIWIRNERIKKGKD